MQPSKPIQVSAIVHVPAVIGMIVKRRASAFAAEADKPARIVSAVLIPKVVAGVLMSDEGESTAQADSRSVITTLRAPSRLR